MAETELKPCWTCGHDSVRYCKHCRKVHCHDCGVDARPDAPAGFREGTEAAAKVAATHRHTNYCRSRNACEETIASEIRALSPTESAPVPAVEGDVVSRKEAVQALENMGIEVGASYDERAEFIRTRKQAIDAIVALSSVSAVEAGDLADRLQTYIQEVRERFEAHSDGMNETTALAFMDELEREILIPYQINRHAPATAGTSPTEVEKCKRCNGTGEVEGYGGNNVYCGHCAGTGRTLAVPSADITKLATTTEPVAATGAKCVLCGHDEVCSKGSPTLGQCSYPMPPHFGRVYCGCICEFAAASVPTERETPAARGDSL